MKNRKLNRKIVEFFFNDERLSNKNVIQCLH